MDRRPVHRAAPARLATFSASLVFAAGVASCTRVNARPGQGDPNCDRVVAASPKDAGDLDPRETFASNTLASVLARCCATPARPLTAGSFTQTDTGITVHWPEGWSVVAQQRGFVLLHAPVTAMNRPVGPAIPGEAMFRMDVMDPLPDTAASRAGSTKAGDRGDGVTPELTLLGQPATLGWGIYPVVWPDCPGACAQEFTGWPGDMGVTGSIQLPKVSRNYPRGADVHIGGWGPVNAQPSTVFCDMQAMILGVTLRGM
jgi:hypothetical protein